jgi:hypothetical protein
MLGWLLLFLLSIIAAADVTTTITFTDIFTPAGKKSQGRRDFGFHGSVIDVDASTTTVLLGYDFDTDFSYIGVENASNPITAILAPSSVSLHEDVWWWKYPMSYDLDCKRPPAATATTCIDSFQGPGVNDLNCLREDPITRSDKTFQRTVYTWCSQTSVVPESMIADHVL